MLKSGLMVSFHTLLLTAAMFGPAPLYAQQQQQQQEETEQEADSGDDVAEVTEEPAQEPEVEQSGSDLPDIDNQPIQPGSGGPGRFIPSEQISQDLGVSFPVDI